MQVIEPADDLICENYVIVALAQYQRLANTLF